MFQQHRITTFILIIALHSTGAKPPDVRKSDSTIKSAEINTNPKPMLFAHLTDVYLPRGDAHIVVQLDVVMLSLYVNFTVRKAEHVIGHQDKSTTAIMDELHQINTDARALVNSMGLMEVHDLHYENNTRQLFNNEVNAYYHSREKRQFLIAAGILGNALFSLYNNYQLSEIRKNANRNAKNIETIALAVHELDTKVGQNTKAIMELNDKFKHGEDKLNRYTTLLQLRNTCRSAVQNARIAMIGMRSGIADPTIFQPDRLQTALENIQIEASRFDMYPITTSPRDLAQLKTSFQIVADGHVLIFIHVPLTSAKLTYKAYQFNSLPIPTPLGHFELTAAKNILITGSHPSEFFALTPQEFNNCDKLSSGVLCQPPDVFETPSTEDHTPNLARCLYALKFNFHHSIAKSCQVRPVSALDRAIRIRDNTYSLFSHNKTSFTYSCPHQEDSVAEFSGLVSIDIHPGCSIQANSFALHAPFTIPKPEEDRPWQFLHLPDPIKAFQALSKETLLISQQHNHTIQLLLDQERSNLDKLKNPSRFAAKVFQGQPLAIALVVVSLILFAFIAALVLYCYCKRKLAKKATNKTLRNMRAAAAYQPKIQKAQIIRIEDPPCQSANINEIRPIEDHSMFSNIRKSTNP